MTLSSHAALAVLLIVLASAPALAQNPACALAPTDLLAWWPGDSNALDVKGGRDGIAVAGFAKGKVRRAFQIGTGTGEFVSIPDDPAWTLGGDFTIDLWVNIATITDRLPFISHDEGEGTAAKWIFGYDATGVRDPGAALRFHINGEGLQPVDAVVAPWTPVAAVWYHVAVTRSANTYAVYVDGERLALESEPTVLPDPAVTLRIGRSAAASMAGLLDEVEIVNGRAMSTEEIAAIFAAGSAGKCKCAGRPVTLVSASGGTSGTEARDVILGSAADDEIQGNGGNDLICGGRGNDVLNGGAGRDRLIGGLGNDRLGGGAERDRLVGQGGDDDMFGGEGDDLLRGGDDGDLLDGDVGDDELNGGEGSDRCDGGAGADTIDVSCEIQ